MWSVVNNILLSGLDWLVRLDWIRFAISLVSSDAFHDWNIRCEIVVIL